MVVATIMASKYVVIPICLHEIPMIFFRLCFDRIGRFQEPPDNKFRFLRHKRKHARPPGSFSAVLQGVMAHQVWYKKGCFQSFQSFKIKPLILESGNVQNRVPKVF